MSLLLLGPSIAAPTPPPEPPPPPAPEPQSFRIGSFRLGFIVEGRR